jgi:hypothetical protein
MRRAVVLAWTLLSIAIARPALAEPVGVPADPDALLKEGIALRRAGRDREALEVFRRAYAVAPSPHALAQVALAEQAIGAWVDAEADLSRALAAADDSWIATHRELLEGGLGTIRAHLGWLDVAADVAGAELWVNDARAGTLPLARPVRIEAGSVAFEVRASGYAPVRRSTSVEPGGTARASVHLVPLPRSATTDETTESPLVSPHANGSVVVSNRPLRNAGLVLVGAGAVGLVASGYFGLRTLSEKSDREDHCLGGVCDATGLAHDQEARSFAVRSTVWFVAGLAAVAGGTGLLWISRSRIVTPVVGPDRAGVDVGGSF